VVIDALRAMGARISQADRDAYVHLWLVTGYFMGIEYEHLFPNDRRYPEHPPLNYEELRAVVYRHHHRKSEFNLDGVRLQQALLEAQRLSYPGALRNVLAGLPGASVRYFLGDEAAEDLGLPDANWTRHLFVIMRPFNGVRTYAYHVDPIAKVVRRRSYGMFTRYIRDATRGRRPAWRVDALVPRRARRRAAAESARS
jgi:ER-bound oxygenase mpaB/B'/Rubber oxygenase, catalytic domain